MIVSKQFFEGEMNKLCEQFNSRNYSTRKIDLFWLEAKNLEGELFTKVIDSMIGNSKFAPTLENFREHISIEREKYWRGKKREDSILYTNAYQFLTKQQKVEGLKFICKNFDSPNKLNKFAKRLDEVIKYKCNDCSDTGIVSLKEKTDMGPWLYESTFKCHCKLGIERLEAWSIYKRIG